MEIESSLRHELITRQRRHRAPSVSIALIRDGEVVWSDAAGHPTGRPGSPTATPQTPYRIGSITKTFVAVAVLQLVRDGAVALDDPITDHLPELDESVRGVTVGSLLNHSSGLHAETQGPWWERSDGLTWKQLLPSVRRAHRPGARFHYSNVGYAVAGELVARQRNSCWFDAVRNGILDPLELTRTTYERPDNAAPGWAVHPHADLLHDEPTHDSRAMAPAGQLWSTVGDLAAWARFLARGDERVLPDDLRLDMHVPGVVDDTPGGRWSRAYGLGLDVFNIDGRRFIGHGGSMPGYLAALRIDPVTGDGFAVQANTTGNFDLDLGYDLLKRFDELSPRDDEPWTATGSIESLDITGTWFWGPREHVATLHGGVLELRPVRVGRGSRFAMREGVWVGLEDYYAGERLQMHVEDGAQYLDLGSFRFTRTPYDPDADLPGGAHPDGWH
ncbi:serine hydrolase domain-containing protein [Yimella sp. NH-Cas1]|uniref:serine hydrolase domain-containing protein n=1 Tax=Yimella sp. NH-Cas1 TaxID=2917726 RepID=UPI001EFC20A5|nr:beta-lactamase family protein [Yimella sp. NH-Cas1]